MRPLRDYIKDGAEIVAGEARRISSSFSVRTPASTRVHVRGELVSVETDSSTAPMARPFQGGLRHPLFGNRKHWYKQPFFPYMTLAWQIKKPDMERKMAQWADDIAKEKLG